MGESVLSAEVKKEIAAAVAKGVSEGVIAALQETGNCSCDLAPAAAKEVGHFMGMVKDLGDGEHAKGIERMREHHKVMGCVVKGRNTFWMLAFKLSATALLLFLGAAVVRHFNAVVK